MTYNSLQNIDDQQFTTIILTDCRGYLGGLEMRSGYRHRIFYSPNRLFGCLLFLTVSVLFLIPSSAIAQTSVEGEYKEASTTSQESSAAESELPELDSPADLASSDGIDIKEASSAAENLLTEANASTLSTADILNTKPPQPPVLLAARIQAVWY